MSESDMRGDRIRKLDALVEAGMEGYPVHSDRTVSIADFLTNFEKYSTQVAILGGRIMSIRGQGGIVFADLFDGSTTLTTGGSTSFDKTQDKPLTTGGSTSFDKTQDKPLTGGTGKTQVVLQKTDVEESVFSLFVDAVDVGDFVEVTGNSYTTKRGERSLKVSKWKMLSKALLAIPDEWYGLKDEETILRQRYLDILLNEEVRKMFVRRSKFWQSAREFYLSRGFLEVETPILETTPGGADARPFKTHHNALDIDVYLRISVGELWQKELLIAGFPKVFEIGRIFRNEGQSREHLQDYTQLESYEAFSDAKAGMEFVKDLYRHIAKETYGQYTFTIGDHTIDLAEEWSTIDFCESIQGRFGINPVSCSEEEAIECAKSAGVRFGDAPNKARAVDSLWKQIRKSVSGPAFLVGVPVFLEPLAKRAPGREQVVDRIQVLLAGSEMGKGYSELNDPQDQRARFEEQQSMRDAGDDEAQRLDEEYIRAMEYGMPPAFGFGVSERLFSFLENRPAHEAQIFPLLRPKSS